MSTIINGSQLTLYPAITTEKNGKYSYQQLFTLNSPIASDDQDDSFVNSVENQNINQNINLESQNLINCTKFKISILNKICQTAFDLQSGNRFLDSYKSLLKKASIQRE